MTAKGKFNRFLAGPTMTKTLPYLTGNDLCGLILPFISTLKPGAFVSKLAVNGKYSRLSDFHVFDTVCLNSQ